MKTFLDVCRLVFISPEALVAVAVVGLAVAWPDAVIFFSRFVGSTDPAIVVGIIMVPPALIVAAYKIGESLLRYAADTGLVKWKGYWRLRYRANFSGVVCVINFFSTFTAWYLVHRGMGLLGTSLMLGGWGMSGASIISLALARIKLRDIIAAEE